MTEAEIFNFEKEVERIEAELGDEHLIRMLQYLMSNSPEANEGLMELHSKCREVISKYPPIKRATEKPKQKRTRSQGTIKPVDSNLTAARAQKVKTEKPRVMVKKRQHSLVPLNVQRNIVT